MFPIGFKYKSFAVRLFLFAALAGVMTLIAPAEARAQNIKIGYVDLARSGLARPCCPATTTAYRLRR